MTWCLGEVSAGVDHLLEDVDFGCEPIGKDLRGLNGPCRLRWAKGVVGADRNVAEPPGLIGCLGQCGGKEGRAARGRVA